MEKYVEQAKQTISEVKKVVVGKDDNIRKTLMAMLAGGHILIEDIPGVGKTTMAFSRAMNLDANRIQFTPDVLPSDVTGFNMYDQENKQFTYYPGPILCNLFLADEINRTSPKTQSALLEVMEEQKITVDGTTIPVPSPFIVFATQNPVGSAGTQMLPESQLDRFMISMSLGYPDIDNEINMVKDRHNRNPLDHVTQVMDGNALLEMQNIVKDIYIHDSLYQYIGTLITKTREHEMLELGVSPRGTLALARMAASCAFLQKRDYVVPEDIAFVFGQVVEHRLVLHSKAKLSGLTKAALIDEIIKTVQKPKP